MFCMEEREDNSPSLQRRKRPLSLVLEEIQDDFTVAEGASSSGSSSSSSKEPRLATPEESFSPSNWNKDTAAEVGRKTRRVGISYHQSPPVTTTSSPDETLPTSHSLTSLSHGRLFTHQPPQRKISDNTLKLRREFSDNNEGTDSEAEGDCAVTRLKDTAKKLNLKTRRESYLTWHAKYADQPQRLPEVKVVPETDGKLTKERKEKMDNDLRWIREELVGLRQQDRSLARQLLGIRQELSSLRLAASCEEHQELLAEAQEEMEDLRELSRFDDCPLDILSSSPLRQIGVTKMNLSSRRFSTC